MAPWRIDEREPGDKWVGLHGPGDFFAKVDTDDVDLNAVEIVGKEMVSVLNANWSADFDAKLAAELEQRRAAEEPANG